jgi:hypothetical protein
VWLFYCGGKHLVTSYVVAVQSSQARLTFTPSFLVMRVNVLTYYLWAAGFTLFLEQFSYAVIFWLGMRRLPVPVGCGCIAFSIPCSFNQTNVIPWPVEGRWWTFRIRECDKAVTLSWLFVITAGVHVFCFVCAGNITVQGAMSSYCSVSRLWILPTVVNVQ